MSQEPESAPHALEEIERLQKRVRELEELLSSHRRPEKKTRAIPEKYAGFYEHTPDMIQILGPDGRFLYVNRLWRDVLGYRTEEIRRMTFTDILLPEYVTRWREIFQHLVHEESSLSVRLDLKTRKSETLSLQADVTPVLKKGRLIRTNFLFRLAGASRESRWENDRFFYSSLDMLCILEGGKFRRINPALEKTLGYAPDEFMDRPFLDLTHPDDQRQARREMKRLEDGSPSVYFENRCLCPDGSLRWLAWTLHTVAGGQVYGVARDITDKKELEAELRRLSFTDELTRLYNRRGFMTFARKLLDLASRQKRGVMIALIDVDGLKLINDTYGHGEGDAAIRRMGEILRRVFRESDIVARLGGDEFAVCAVIANEKACRRIHARLKKLLLEDNESNLRPYRLSFSFGCVYRAFDQEASIDNLLVQADRNLYQEKKEKNLPSTR